MRIVHLVLHDFQFGPQGSGLGHITTLASSSLLGCASGDEALFTLPFAQIMTSTRTPSWLSQYTVLPPHSVSAFVTHGSLEFQETFNSISTGRTEDSDGEAALGLLKSVQPAFDKWQSRIQRDPNGYYIRFDPDRRATLIQISAEASRADIGNQGFSALSHNEPEFDALPD